jgi:hypothetical protein
VYLGSTIDPEELERALPFAAFDAVRTDDEQELCDRAAAALAQGELIGWIQGRISTAPGGCSPSPGRETPSFTRCSAPSWARGSSASAHDA